MADRYQPGEIIDAVIKGVRVVGEDELGHVTIADENGDYFPLPGQAAITRVAPAEWPPQLGDLWRDVKGRLWFVRNDTTEKLMTPAESWEDEESPDHVAREFAPLILVRREEADGA